MFSACPSTGIDAGNRLSSRAPFQYRGLLGPGTLEITTLNGGPVMWSTPGIGPSAIPATLSTLTARHCSGLSPDRAFLEWRIEWWIRSSRAAGSGSSVPRLHSTAPTELPSLAEWPSASSDRRDTGTMAISAWSGRASCSSRYRRNAPAAIASIVSLTVTPADVLTARTRAIGQDWAANRRAPVIGTLNMVLGAWNGIAAELSLMAW